MPVERTDTRRSGTAGSWALLGLVVLIGLLLRGYQLGSESLWVDEGYTVKAALRTPGETLRTIGESINAPVYPLLMHEWIRWFGASETALRFPSVIFSVLTILLVHRLARLLFDEATGLLAASVVALSTFHVAYAQEARSYALMALLSTASYYFFAAWPIARRPRQLVGYILTTAILLYTHSFAALVVVTQNLYVLAAARWPRLRPAWRGREWLATQVGVAILYAVWALVILRHLAIVSEGFWIPPPSWGGLRYLAGLYAPRWGWAIFGVAVASQWSRLVAARPGSVAMLAIWLTTTVAVPVVASFSFVPMLEPRYIIAGTVPLYILGAAATMRMRPAWLRTAAVAVLVVAFAWSTGVWHAERHKEDWRNAARYLRTNVTASDLIILHPPFNRSVLDYYLGSERLPIREFPAGVPRPVVGLTQSSTFVTPENTRELEDLPTRYHRIWVVIANPRDPRGLLLGTLRRWYGETEHRAFPYVDVFRLDRLP
jgi:4-amino-4-deoxy-L-arabinose transferase-like glycosyltransferase